MSPRGSSPVPAPHERISAALRSPKKSGEPALVAYLTAGYPARDQFAAQLALVCAGADVVEIGVPFTDPMADGVTIQRASEAALKQGVSLSWILEQLAGMPDTGTPLLLMSYLNPLLSHGFAALARGSVRARVSGFIVPDLPLEESEELRSALTALGIALVQMVTPVTPPARLQRLCQASQGFVYAVTSTGTTGKNVAVPPDLLQYLRQVRAAATVPVCAGFGIRTRSQVESLRGHVDGVIVGSALVEVLERGEHPGPWLQALRGGA